MGKWLETDNITLFSSLYKIVCRIHVFHKVEIILLKQKSNNKLYKLQASDHMQTGTFLQQTKLWEIHLHVHVVI